MKNLTISAIIILIIAACGSSKKGNNTANTQKPLTTITTAKPPKPSNGVYAPGVEELEAVKSKFSGVTLETLTLGHSLYIGACTSCHGIKNIYTYPEESWFEIVADMAPKARLTPAEKDAVYKYVIAIKAAQPK